MIYQLTKMYGELTGPTSPAYLQRMEDGHFSRAERSLPRVGRLKALNPDDYVQTRMSVPASLISRLHGVKRAHNLRTRDAVIGAMLRLARTQYQLTDFSLPPEPAHDDPMQPITAQVQAEQLEFLYRLQRHFRGAALGAVFEAIAAVITDITPHFSLTKHEGDSIIG